MECIFCKIAQNKMPSYKIYEDDKVMAFLDIHPVNFGHVLVVTKEHYENLLMTPDNLAEYLVIVAKRIAKALQEALLAEGINFMINNGKSAGQEIFHTHLHVIPRFRGDGLKLWANKDYSNQGDAVKIANKIRAKL